MTKRQTRISWRYIRTIHPWYFMVIAITFGIISVVSLRHNNEQMIRLRTAVYTADQDDGNVEAALRTLREYVYSHMNTSLASGPNAVHPPIQLKYTYERLQQAQESVLGQGDSSLYAAAQQYCEGQTQIGSQVIACIKDYATSHGANLAPIPDALYKFDFTSAKWSPDLAGWSLVITVFSGLAFLIGSLYHWWMKRYV